MGRTVRIPLIAAATLAALPYTASASCEASEMHRHSFEMSSFEAVEMNALAGRLDIMGTDGDRMVFEGRACSNHERWLEDMTLDIEDSGDELVLTVIIPYDRPDFDARYAHMDITLKLPHTMPISLRDSSGDILVQEASVTSIQDSSGDIRVENAQGSLDIEDSSGDIDVRLTSGSVSVKDSSGNISLKGVGGDVVIPRDSSGEIEIEDVGGAVIIERDSSGSIEVETVAGSVEIGSDGGGGIDISDVEGSVSIGSDGSGLVRVRDVAGDFTLLAKGSGDIRVSRVEGTVTTPR